MYTQTGYPARFTHLLMRGLSAPLYPEVSASEARLDLGSI